MYLEELKKPFVLKLLLSEVRKCGKIVMVVVILCVTSNLIPGSKTAHSDSSWCWTLAIITQQPVDTEAADVIKQVIICDKCTVPQSCFWGIELENISSFWWRNSSFNRRFFVRQFQCLKKTKAYQVKICFKSQQLWKHVDKLKLRANMITYLCK